jgi:hypothetical protein
MDLPNENTLKTIERRKKYLIENQNKNGFVLEEIKALDRIINLLTLIRDKYSDDEIINLIEKATAETNVTGNSDNDNEEHSVIHSYEQEITKNSRLDVSFIENKYDSKKYILLALKKYKPGSLEWIFQGKIKLTPSILEDILKKVTVTF